MNPHLRRLQADHERVKTAFKDHPHIEVKPVKGEPPEEYEVTYKIKGIEDLENYVPKIVEKHIVKIYLPADYPRVQPRCEPVTKIYHPNFGSFVCIGDHWTPSESLAELIIRMGQMIQYKIYNTTNPLDEYAKNWATANTNLFPIDKTDLILRDD